MVVEKPSQAPATPKPGPPQPAAPKASPSPRKQLIAALAKQVADMLNQIKVTLKKK